MKPMFTIIVVCLNPGSKLKETLSSIAEQTCRDYEIVIKDGLSSDGSLEYIQEVNSGRKEAVSEIKLVSQKDRGIYDAMNQAVEFAEGRYLYFLNCGDTFYSRQALEEVKNNVIISDSDILYGNIFERKTGQAVCSNPKLNSFGCYRNVPCHQACFYERKLLVQHKFKDNYKVRADYEHFLWCFFEAKASLRYMEVMIADYEGGGFSETRENRKLSQKEHKEIVGKYMTDGQIFKYRLLLWMTFARVRTMLAENKATAAFYHKVKGFIYRR